MTIMHAFRPQADDDAVCCCGKSKFIHADSCSVCNGTGANPLSDNRNWLPCTECNGSGLDRYGLMIGERFVFGKD